jgi:hypothetical protein
MFQEALDSRSKVGRNPLLSVDEVDHEEVLSAERGETFVSDLLEVAQELRVLDLTVTSSSANLYFSASLAPRMEQAASQIQDSRDLSLFLPLAIVNLPIHCSIVFAHNE